MFQLRSSVISRSVPAEKSWRTDRIAHYRYLDEWSYQQRALNVGGKSCDAYAQVEDESLSDHYLMRYFELSLVLWKNLDDFLKGTLSGIVRSIEVDAVIEFLDQVSLYFEYSFPY